MVLIGWLNGRAGRSLRSTAITGLAAQRVGTSTRASMPFTRPRRGIGWAAWCAAPDAIELPRDLPVDSDWLGLRSPGGATTVVPHRLLFSSAAPSTRQPEWLAFWLEARSKNSGVQRVREAVAHVRRTLVFDVHVELAGVRQEEVHDGTVISELSSRQC